MHEECGVFGVYSTSSLKAAELVYSGLFALQHRGQESCGIAANDEGQVYLHKEMGLVGDVFTQHHLARLPGRIGIGHVRYSTTGQSVIENAQPLVRRYQKGQIALAHNGNLTNTSRLRQQLEDQGAIFQTTIDSEVIAYLVARERAKTEHMEEAIARTVCQLQGAFCLLVMSRGKLIAIRDPYGFRPLCLGQLEDAWLVASESCALDAAGARFVRDIAPGEMLTIDRQGLTSQMITNSRPPNIEASIVDEPLSCGHGASQNQSNMATPDNPTQAIKARPCVFEYIYFARPDSQIDGISVHQVRIRAGELLAKQHPVDADLVIGVPESGIDAAIGYSYASGIPYGKGFMKNNYIGRTFIQPTQARRESALRLKLNPVRGAIAGKRIIMIDDSIVRGTTSARIIRLLKDAGALEVHMRVSSPPFLWPCYFGTDIPSKEQLIARQKSIDAIRQEIGADSLGFLDLDSLGTMLGKRPAVNGLQEPNEQDGQNGQAEHSHFNRKFWCDACFSGDYPPGSLDDQMP